MKRDPRIHLDTSSRAHHEKIAADEAALEASVAEASWIAMLTSLGEVALSNFSGRRATVPLFPVAGDQRVQGAFDHVAKRLIGQDDRQYQPFEHILSRRLAEYIGIHLPKSAVEWDTIVSWLRDWKDWQAFVQSVPGATIDAHLADLTRTPSDPRSSIDSFSSLRDNFQAALQTLDERRKKEPDDWGWLNTVERFADEATLAPAMALRSELLARLGALPWLSWATSFPHAVLVAIAVDDVEDLDFIEELIEHCHEISGNAEQRHLTILLLVKRVLELWERISGSLERAKRAWGVPDADRLVINVMREQWSQVELPNRCRRIATALLASSQGMNAAIDSARHLQSPRQVPPAIVSSGVQAQFRSCLLDELRKGNVDDVLRRLLVPPTLSAGVLAAWLLVQDAPTPQQVDVIFRAYIDWLGAENFYWVGPLDGHDREVVDAVASLLASSPAPVEGARTLLSMAQSPQQGWGFDLAAWFEAVPRITHVQIVIASAAARMLIGGDVQGAPGLMELAWRDLDLLLRGSPMSNTSGHVSSAVAHVWAYASKVFPSSEERVSKAIGRFDDVRLMISAAQNFKANAGALPTAAKESMRRTFETRLPILERHPHISPEALAELRRQVAELTS